MIRPVSFVGSLRVLHNVVANGRVLFVDCVGVGRGHRSVHVLDIGEVISDDKKHTIVLLEEKDVDRVLELAKKKMAVIVIGVLFVFLFLAFFFSFLLQRQQERRCCFSSPCRVCAWSHSMFCCPRNAWCGIFFFCPCIAC